MSLPRNLTKFAKKPIQVMDDGHVMLVDVMGDEQAIIDAARVSYGAGTKRVLEDRGLIRYLLRNSHTSPFEMCEIKIRIRVPMDVWRQWVRHRTASINEYSTRYSEAIDSTVTTEPDQWRLQSSDNKQGSSGLVTKWIDGFVRPITMEDVGGDRAHFGECLNGGWIDQNFYGNPGCYLSEREEELHVLSREVYEERLKFGVAREQARKDLPLSTYTEAYWKCDLHNLLHFLRLRMHPHAQLEIRLFANAIAEIVKVWVPTVWEAFEEYTLNSIKLSASEMKGLRGILRYQLTVDGLLNYAVEASGLKGREAGEFRQKLKMIVEG